MKQIQFTSSHRPLRIISLAVVVVVLMASQGNALDITGAAAPDFTLKSISGSDIALSSLKGRVVLLNFWATWCPACKDEMPSMNSIYLKYKDSGLVVVAVSTDDSTKAVEKFLSSNPVDFPILLDSGMKVAKRKYRINAQPTTFLINKDGTVVNRYFGSINWMDDSIQKEIIALF